MLLFENIVQKMCKLGFTLYEARAYVSLLENHPATRYEIGKNSGVPRSGIYNVISRLESYGAVSVISANPEKYVPLPPDKFIKMLKQTYKEKLEGFRESLCEIKMNIETEQLWNISGYHNLIAKSEEIIKEAKSELYISAWQSEILELEDAIREAENRNIKVVMFSFTELPEIGQIYCYGLKENELEKVWDHKIVLVRDHEELVMGEVNKKQQKKAAWTKNKAIVEIAENYIILDITLFGIRAGVDIRQVVIEKNPGELFLLNELLQARFPDNPVLNMDFSQYSIKENNKIH